MQTQADNAKQAASISGSTLKLVSVEKLSALGECPVSGDHLTLSTYQRELNTLFDN